MTSADNENGARWPINSLLRQLRPDPGFEIERAVFASYSADLRVVAAVLMALTGSAQDPEVASRVRFAQALRKLRGKVAFVVQRGRIHKPKALAAVSALLDRFIFEADCPEGIIENAHSWHPKFAVTKWRNERDASNGTWRVWLGSRNLTRDLSRDVGLLLTEGNYSLSHSSSKSLLAAVDQLQSWLPDNVRPLRSQDVLSLKQAKWKLPVGVRNISLHWIAGTSEFPQGPQQYDRAIVVSPFIDAASIHSAIAWMKPGLQPVIAAPEVELQRECPPGWDPEKKADVRILHGSPDDGLPYRPLPSAKEPGNDDTADQEDELDRSDEASRIHAKLIYLSSGKSRYLWLGSPNFTDRGWTRNFELAARLEATFSNNDWFDALNGIIRVCQTYVPAHQEEAAADRAKDLLEKTRKALCLNLKVQQRRDKNRVQLHAEQPLPPLPAGMELRVSSPWPNCSSNIWMPGNKSADLGALPLELCSDFVLFELALDGIPAHWIMRVPFYPPLADDRDNAGLSTYLGPAGYMDLIAAQLTSSFSGSSPPWDAPPDHPPVPKGLGWKHIKGPTLEALLRLYISDKTAFAAFGETVSIFRQEAHRWPARDVNTEALWQELDAFNRLWDDLGNHLLKRAVRGT